MKNTMKTIIGRNTKKTPKFVFITFILALLGGIFFGILNLMRIYSNFFSPFYNLIDVIYVFNILWSPLLGFAVAIWFERSKAATIGLFFLILSVVFPEFINGFKPFPQWIALYFYFFITLFFSTFSIWEVFKIKKSIPSYRPNKKINTWNWITKFFAIYAVIFVIYFSYIIYYEMGMYVIVYWPSFILIIVFACGVFFEKSRIGASVICLYAFSILVRKALNNLNFWGHVANQHAPMFYVLYAPLLILSVLGVIGVFEIYKFKKKSIKKISNKKIGRSLLLFIKVLSCFFKN